MEKGFFLLDFGLVFNLIGGVLMAFIYFRSHLPLGNDGWILKHFVINSANKTNLDFTALLIRGVFCNVFVCMAVYTATAAKDTAGKVLGIMFMIAVFVASGYEHCVANMFIIAEGLIGKAYYLSELGDLRELSLMLGVSLDSLESLSIYGFLVKNLIPVTIGNIIGGFVLVGLVNLVTSKRG